MTALPIHLQGAALSDLARRITELSINQWGESQATVLVGMDASLLDAQYRLLQFAQADSPVLITGETGTGKELFARALYLLCERRRRPFLCVNCAQYQDGQLLVSELFGHRKGSFTGAINDRRGVFEEADRGVVFLDEIGELPLTAQAMLLRTLSEGEVLPVGESRAHRVDVRIVAATSRDLRPMIAAGTFREDLFYRLRFLRLRIPALRERGRDWELATQFFLTSVAARRLVAKSFSPRAMDILGGYSWPGNVRELKSVVDMGFHMSPDALIEPEHFAAELDTPVQPGPSTAGVPPPLADRYARMALARESFWDVVHQPFMNRDLNRREVRQIIMRGLQETGGRYKDLLLLFGIEATDYLRFMDFLRHHRLKADPRGRTPAAV